MTLASPRLRPGLNGGGGGGAETSTGALIARSPVTSMIDDLSYVQKSQAETSVLFELISARYERRPILITANQPFGAWDAIFPDPAMTVAAIDRLVHHANLLGNTRW